MRAFLTTLTLTACMAGGVWWHQRGLIAAWQSELIARSAVPDNVPAVVKPSSLKPAKRKEPFVALHQPDGSPLVNARSPMRGALQAAKYVRTLSREALVALLSGEEPDDMGESGGVALAGWGRLGEMDPRAALALAITKDNEGFYVVLHDWLIRDRAAALAWFHEQPDSEAKANFSTVAGLVLASSDPELLGQLSGSIDDAELQRKSLTQSLIAQSATDPDAAIARLTEVTDAESRKTVVQALCAIHGSTRPRQLLELALPMAVEGTEPQPMLANLLRADFEKNPAEALQWLTGRSSAEIAALRADVSGFYLNSVGTLDFPVVQAAANRLERPEDREWLLANYQTGRAGKEPLAALESLSNDIHDPALRQNAINFVLSGSVRTGRETNVEPWVTAQPAKEQEALRKQMAEWKAAAEKK